MKLEHLNLTNFQSYADESLDFNDGVTLIHGQNGAGKSTLLRAVFAGLYQADATTETSAEYGLVDFVNKDEDTACVELTFSISDIEYTIEWELTVTEDDEGDRKASTKTCVLTSDVYDDPIEGVTAVRETVEGLLGMGATEFANSVYVQQKRLSRLIDANERERKEILDSLLGFDQLDTYIERMKRARRPVKRTREDAQSRRQEVQERIDDFDEDTLREAKRQYSEDIDTWESKVTSHEESVTDLQRKLDTLTERLSEYEDIAEDIDRLDADIKDKQETIDDIRDEIQSRHEEIDRHRDSIDTHQEEIRTLSLDSEDYSFDSAAAAETAKSSLDTEWEQAYETEQEAKNDVTRHQDTVDRLESEKTAAQQTLDDANDTRNTTQAAVNEAKQRVDTCREAVDDAVDARNSAVAEFLAIEPDDVTDETRDEVDTVIDETDSERERLGNRISELSAEKEQVESHHEALSDDLESAREEYDTLAATVDIGDTTDPKDEFEAAVEDADAVGNQFSVTVTADGLYDLLQETLPELRDAILDEYHTVAGEWADAVADKRYFDRLLNTIDTLPDGGSAIQSDADDEPVPLERGALADALADAQMDTSETADEREAAADKLRALDTLATSVARALQLRALARAGDDVDSIEQEQADLDTRIEDITTELTSLREEQTRLANRVDTGDLVLDHFERVETKRETLSDAEEDLEEAEEDLEEADATVEEAQQELDSIEADLEDARADLEDARATHADAEERVNELANMRDAAADAVEHYDAISDLESSIETLQEGIGQRNKRIRGLTDTIEGLEEDLQSKRDELGGLDLDGLRTKRNKAETALDTANDNKAYAQEQLNDARESHMTVENQLSQLQTERERADSLDEQIEWADDIVSELTGIIETYEEVKLNLRAQTLDLLNKYTNEVFDDLYHSESYIGIRIDNDYNIKLVDSGNQTMDPDKGSGGEGVITNIALRAGVYRVIADQETGSAGLPPFILDEPTNHLDSVHLSQIEGVIDSVQEWDVPQVFVVSHREALIENADNELYVDKDPATDTSTAHIGGPPDGTGGGLNGGDS